MNPSPPVLTQLKVSNYNEKARWALDFKGIPHARNSLEPGRHSRQAQRLAGVDTLPILELDGEAIGDSTAIIEALEELQPGPPLYPQDAAEREHALQLEDHFDEELGPYSRILAIGHTSGEASLFLGAFFPDMGGARRAAARLAFPLIRRQLKSGFELTQENIDLSFEKLGQAGDLLRREKGSRDYLVGERFTVADLTLAALLSPLVAPPEFPYPQPQRDHPVMAPVREALGEAGLTDWCREMYARHRGTSAEIAA
jgi:glutathione S-transferase